MVSECGHCVTSSGNTQWFLSAEIVLHHQTTRNDFPENFVALFPDMKWWRGNFIAVMISRHTKFLQDVEIVIQNVNLVLQFRLYTGCSLSQFPPPPPRNIIFQNDTTFLLGKVIRSDFQGLLYGSETFISEVSFLLSLHNSLLGHLHPGQLEVGEAWIRSSPI